MLTVPKDAVHSSRKDMAAGRKDVVPIVWITTPHPHTGNKTWTGNGADNEFSKSTPVVAPTQHQAREGKQEKASPTSQVPECTGS